ncbi:MAG: TetR/AcrR family transcriptional regulator [Nannocystaceae bacterium]
MVRPQQITDAQITDAARAVFLEHGPGASVRLVARRLGVSHAAVLQRAGSKTALLRRALRPGAPEVAEALARGPDPDRPIDEQLIEHLLSAHDFLQQLVPSLVVLRAAGHDFEHEERVAPPIHLRRLLAAWLTKARRAGAPRMGRPVALAEALLGALEARCFNGYIGGSSFVSGSPQRFVRSLVAALVSGPPSIPEGSNP